VVSGEAKLVIGVRIIIMLVLRRIYVVVEGVEVVGKAIVATKVVVCVLVIAEIYGLKAVSRVSKVSKVSKV
jgi:chromate transport protein ChrA